MTGSPLPAYQIGLRALVRRRPIARYFERRRRLHHRFEVNQLFRAELARRADRAARALSTIDAHESINVPARGSLSYRDDD